jgi:hypothetical protein
MQRVLTLAAGGRTHARRHQAAVGPWDQRGHEGPRFGVQRAWATHEVVHGVGDCFRTARTGSTDPNQTGQSEVWVPQSRHTSWAAS